MYLSISRLFLRWRGPKSIAKLDGVMAGFSPGSATGITLEECHIEWRNINMHQQLVLQILAVTVVVWCCRVYY